MKNVNFISAIFLLVMTGCGGNRQAGNDTEGFITVDVTKNYSPQKELILQDFMDVEYIALETKKDFYNQGFVQTLGEKVILVKNRVDDGDIFVYDRNGKCLRKFNRKGQGPEEYTFILGIALDEDNGEMFVNDHSSKKIVVYDLYGNFKRSFKHKEGGGSLFYTDIFNYDRDNLICYDAYNKEIAFVLVSKQDGSITKEIHIPFKEKKAAIARMRDEKSGMTYAMTPGPYRSIIPFNGNWLLAELSTDTIFRFLPDYSLCPFLVRTPSIQSMNPEEFLYLRLLSDRYYFMETIRNVYDFDSRRGFDRTFFMYDKQENAILGYTVYNGDYLIKKELYMNALRPVNHEIESWQRIDADQLVEDYEKGVLKGKLKEIAASLKEEDNPVIMLVKHKK